jgi:pimeloyl-ACP methyl ester carboxylesterase
MRSAWLLPVLLAGSGTAQAADCVVLLHGLARTAGAMEPMQAALADAGFATANVDYPSRAHTIEELAPIAVEAGVDACRAYPGIDRIHFVTHSLGGILLRWYLAEYDITGLGRVVMLGPPNQGSVAADRMRNVPGYDWLNGPIGRQLGKGPASVPLALPAADFEVGIIAGNRTIDPITSAILPDPDDGRVSVEDTKLAGMKDFVVVEHSHAFLMSMHEPIELTIRFLQSGEFGQPE